MHGLSRLFAPPSTARRPRFALGLPASGHPAYCALRVAAGRMRSSRKGTGQGL